MRINFNIHIAKYKHIIDALEYNRKERDELKLESKERVSCPYCS